MAEADDTPEPKETAPTEGDPKPKKKRKEEDPIAKQLRLAKEAANAGRPNGETIASEPHDSAR